MRCRRSLDDSRRHGAGDHATGPSDRLKWFSSAYALFSGVMFLSSVSVMLAPVVHRFRIASTWRRRSARADWRPWDVRRLGRNGRKQGATAPSRVPSRVARRRPLLPARHRSPTHAALPVRATNHKDVRCGRRLSFRCTNAASRLTCGRVRVAANAEARHGDDDWRRPRLVPHDWSSCAPPARVDAFAMLPA